MDARVGWAEFDALAEPFQVNVGWAEFDAQGAQLLCFVGWAEFDCRSPGAVPIPPYAPGGGTTRYHSRTKQQYDIPVFADTEDDEERIVLEILMEIAKNEIC